MRIFKSIGKRLRSDSRFAYEAMMYGSRQFAKWKIENSTTILERRKKILFLCLLPVLFLAGLEFVHAVEIPSIIGGKHAYAPSFATMEMFFVSILIGLAAGLITGCIGAGGGFILTPALMSVGVKGIMAVGTDMFHIFAKAIMGATLHRKMGNVSAGLAITFLIGSLAGATAGGLIQRAIYTTNPALSDAFIGVLYVVVLGFIGFFTLFDFLKARKQPQGSGGAHDAPSEMTNISVKMQSLKAPPYIKFDQNKKLSAYPIILLGVIVGIVAALMGVGGGFLFFPSFVYILGVSAHTTVGTDIFQIIFTAGYASIFQYAVYGFVFYTLAMGLLLGSLIGIQIGAITTSIVSGIVIKGFFALTVLGGFANRLFDLPNALVNAGYLKVSPTLLNIFDFLSFYLFFAIIAVFGVWVIYSFFKGMPKIRQAAFEDQQEHNET